MREGSCLHIYQVFRGLSCQFGISRDYHIFVCGSGCHKFDLVISFTAAAVQPSERMDLLGGGAKEKNRVDCGAGEDHQGAAEGGGEDEGYQNTNMVPKD